MQINYIAGTNFGRAPSWLTTVLGEVSAFYDKLFTNNITINVTVNWVPLAGDALASNSLTGGSGVIDSFSTVSAALADHAQYAIQSGAYANMPTGVSSVYVAPGEAEVLGLSALRAEQPHGRGAAAGHPAGDRLRPGRGRLRAVRRRARRPQLQRLAARRPGVPACDRVRHRKPPLTRNYSSSAFAVSNTAANIAGVSRPVLVFSREQ
jgi:hypothetical protein